MAKERRKILKKKRERKTKNEKRSNNNTINFFTFTYILLENMFERT